MRTVKKLGFSPFAFGVETQKVRQRQMRGFGAVTQLNLSPEIQRQLVNTPNLQQALRDRAAAESGAGETPWYQTKTAKVAAVGAGIAVLTVLVLA